MSRIGPIESIQEQDGRGACLSLTAGYLQPAMVHMGAHVYLSTVSAAMELGPPEKLLSRPERLRARKMKHEEAATRFIAGRLLLRHVLSDFVGNRVRPNQWRFRLETFGRPVVVCGFPRIPFSVSHAENYVAVVLRAQGDVGIDIERIEQSQARLLTDVMSDNELSRMAAKPLAEADREFVALWAAKEACAKALGQGLTIDFRDIDVDLDAQTCEVAGRPWSSDPSAGLTVRELAMPEGHYVLALAMR